MLHFNFSGAEKGEILFSSFHKTSVTLTLKLFKESIRKRENYRQTSFENFDTKLPNKMQIK